MDVVSRPEAANSALTPLALHVRRVTGPVVGREVELGAIRQELASAKAGRLTALTLEGEPGIGKTRLMLEAGELAAAEGFTTLAATADEEIRGPFLLARGVFSSWVAGCGTEDDGTRDQLQRVLDAITGHDDPSLDTLSPDQKLLRVFDLAAVAIRSLASAQPVALLVDDLQWADEDSVRMLRYVVRTDADLPVFLALATRRDELAVVNEAVTLIADMERMGMVRRLRLERFTQLETTEFVQQVLGGKVNLSSAATMHAQAEGVAFIVEELARTYRQMGLIQEIDGTWTLAGNAARLLPSAVHTLIQRRAARLPGATKENLADAAILGRSFSLKDLRSVKIHLGADEGCNATVLAESLAPAVQAGLLAEHPAGSPADYSFTHDQVREFAAALLTTTRRRDIHTALVDMLTADGDPSEASLALLAHHALAAGDAERAVRFSIMAARAALDSRAAEEALRVVDQALEAASAAHDRVALLVAQDDALSMLRRPADRHQGLAELAALAEALGDQHLELDVKLRRAAAFRVSEDEDRAAELARSVREAANERADRRAELAACLELGQDLLRSALGESFSAPSDVDLDGAGEAFGRASELARERGDTAALAAAERELGVVSIARLRQWYAERVETGEIMEIMAQRAAGKTPEEIMGDLPVARFRDEGVEHYERAIALFEKVGDRRGVMSAIIARAYVDFGLDLHLGAAKRVEEIRRLAGQMASLTRESERATVEAHMLYGVQVFARAKVVPDLALSRGEEAHRQAQLLGDRSLEFAAATGLALTHIELDDVAEAARWVDRAAEAASAAPTPLKARELETARGIVRAAAGDAHAMRDHLERALRLATEQGRPAARCEALATLALHAARLGAGDADAELLELAERSAREAKALVDVLPGHPPWGAMGDAALAVVALAREDAETAAAAARSAFGALQAAHREDLSLEIILPAAQALLVGGTEHEREIVLGQVTMAAALIAQRITDEAVRVRWFRGPLGCELSRLAGRELGEAPPERTVGDGAGRDLDEEDTGLLWLLIQGRTNREIAEDLGVSEEDVVRRLAEMYARIGVSSRGEAAVFAFREGMV